MVESSSIAMRRGPAFENLGRPEHASPVFYTLDYRPSLTYITFAPAPLPAYTDHIGVNHGVS